METLQHLFQYILHIDQYLIAFVSHYGTWAYAALFAIIFCETGLVVTPFLPGDSLLFAAGSIAAHESQVLDIKLLFLLLVMASLLGNKVNYFIGKMIGPHVFLKTNDNTHSWLAFFKRYFFNQKHLERAHQFYNRHGGKTIIIARFIPVIRTFVPFVAGVSNMDISRFSFYNLVSGLIWIGSLLGAGFYFGNLPIVKDNFSIVIYGVVIVSLAPPVLIYLYRKTFVSS